MVLYTERESRFIHDAKLFEDHVLIRPLGRGLDSPVERLTYAEFEKRFEEFCGDPQRVEELLGLVPEEGVVTL